MQVRTDSVNGSLVASPADTIKTFQVETLSCKDQWTQQLQDDPDCFADIEQQIDQHYRLGAGHLVASLLADVTSGSQMDDHIEQIRRNAAIPLRAPQPRTLKIRLLCGLMLWVSSAISLTVAPYRREHNVHRDRAPGSEVPFGIESLMDTPPYTFSGQP